MTKKHILILGGGFAGLRVARLLTKQTRHVEVTLITESTTFRYSPALYRSATGFKLRESIIPLSQITKNYPNFKIIHQKVEKIDRSSKSVTTADGKLHKYDYVVVCLGVVTSYFGIPGLEQFSFSIKTPDGLQKLKTHLHKTLNDTGEPDANYVVVGGGSTGVELSAALGKYLKYIANRHKVKKHSIKLELVEAAPRLLPALKESASYLTERRLHKLGVKLMLGEAVKAETATTLKLADRSIPTHTVIWTAGVTNNPFFKQNQSEFTINERGKVVVNDFLQVDDFTYVIGDNAATKYSGLAQVAIWDANYTARQILRQIKGRHLLPYHQTKPASVVPAGETWSILQYGSWVFSGKIPALIRSIADLIGYTDVMGPKQAFAIWRRKSESEETCKVCSVALKD